MEIIDLTPYRCPYPLVKVKLLLKELQQGENLLVHLSDPGSRKDVPAFIKKMGFEMTVSHQDVQKLSLIITKA